MREGRKLRLAATIAAALAVGGGCSSGNLVFTTYTKFGVDVAATNGSPTDAMLGYKRFEGAILPVDRDAAADGGVPKDAKSVIATMKVENAWLGGVKIFQVFGTGAAAENIARNPQALEAAVLAVAAADGGQ